MKKQKHYILTRDVTPEECHWLEKTWTKGEIVCHYAGPTYGCISPMGTAISPDGNPPFTELPIDALEKADG